MILGNCLDNSIEAVCKLDDVSKREVNVDLVYRKKGLLIRISNPFSGDIKKDTNGNLVTTKADKENHGREKIHLKPYFLHGEERWS